MAPKEDFSSTFGRVFGEDHVAQPLPLPSGCSPFAPLTRGIADRENFGMGFRRAPGTGAFSPRTRTRCVQDIILRDRSSSNADPLQRYDVIPAARCSPTTAVTSTIYHDAKVKSTSPQMVTGILPGLDASEEQPVPRPPSREFHGQLRIGSPRPGQRTSPRARSHSPGKCRSPFQVQEDWRNTLASQENREESGPAHLTKKRFPERLDFGGGRVPQQPGLDGGEFAANIVIGEVPVPENLELRPEQAELNKKLSQRRKATGHSINEWQYRTREIVTMRSKEHGKLRWH